MKNLHKNYFYDQERKGFRKIFFDSLSDTLLKYLHEISQENGVRKCILKY